MKSLIDRIQSLFAGKGEAAPSGPVAFGYKTAWVAVRSNDSAAVASALSLRSRRRAGWQMGVDAAYVYPPKEVFVTPPINGWVCVVGLWVAESLDSTEKNLASLSAQFGEAHAYANHRVVGLAQWIVAKDGRVLRCFSYLGERGEIMRDSGTATDVELTLRPSANSGEEWYPDEQDVMTVAGAWSFDPSGLTVESGPPAFGVLGIAG